MILRTQSAILNPAVVNTAAVAKRVGYVDIAKGIGIILVVMGHNDFALISPFVHKLIYSFHMPMFFFMSGMFFKPDLPFWNFIRQRFHRLLKPFGVMLLQIYFASLSFSKVSLVMATYNGVTYFSETHPADMESLQVNINIPVYDTITDLAAVRVEQMHVLLEPALDGLETKELYIISNQGERTVKDVFDLGEGKFATLKFPLPEDADYLFFKPDDQERFVKLSGAFADTYALLPGGQPLQIMTSYLMPYSGKREFTYKAPVDVTQINFLLPNEAGISLQGSGLAGPESTVLQDGRSYQVYSYSDLTAGQMLSVTLTGGTARDYQESSNPNNLFAALAAFLGFGVIGFGVWRWRTSAEAENEVSTDPDEPTLDELIAEIARLDEKHEQDAISSEEYQTRRQALMQKAKQLL